MRHSLSSTEELPLPLKLQNEAVLPTCSAPLRPPRCARRMRWRCGARAQYRRLTLRWHAHTGLAPPRASRAAPEAPLRCAVRGEEGGVTGEQRRQAAPPVAAEAQRSSGGLAL